MVYDLIVIGAGPAGISAAVYAASRGLCVLTLEKEKVGGIIRKVSTVTHYAGISPGETGTAFAERLEQQALRTGVEIRYEQVIKTALTGDIKHVETISTTYEAPAVIIANGTTPRKLGITGEQEFAGKGIGSLAATDGPRYQGKNIYVIGGADGALKEAIFLAQFAKKITVVAVEKQLSAIPEFVKIFSQLSNTAVLTGKRLTAVSGTDHVTELELTDEASGIKTTLHDDGCGIFIYAGSTPSTALYTELPLTDGYIPVTEKMETILPGVFVAGDIRVKQLRQVATAVSDGALAGINAVIYLKGKGKK
jgi:thioredoxin reductase (NADPH)